MHRALRSSLSILAVGILASCAVTPVSSPAAIHPAQPPELVVLAHGMGRTVLSMLPLEVALERSGYRVLNYGYSSYGPSIAQISEDLAGALAAELSERPAPRVHFVGHSLGNIIVRHLLDVSPPSAELGRFVMLAPPNQGSAMADTFAPYLGWLLPPISELRTRESTVVHLPPPDGVRFAIVAGRRDGKVSLREACLPGADAYAVVPSGHTFIAVHPAVIRLVRDYLGDGELPENGTGVSPCSEANS